MTKLTSYRGGLRALAWRTCCLGAALQVLAALAQQKTLTPPGLASTPAKAPEEYRRLALLREGDPVRGRELFANEQKVACSKCHTVDGTAAKAGPDLFAVGDKFGRGEIIDSILSPSQTIADGYAAVTIQTKSGEEYTGIIKQATDSWLELMGGDGQRVRIPLREVELQIPSQVSLMPEGLQNGLTLEEFTDLIEYLVSLKQPASANSLQRGMPAEIQSLAKPIALRPFHGPELGFEHPVWFGPIPGQTNSFLVVEHETGNIWRLDKQASGDTKTLFVNLEPFQKGTRGLLGIALNPRFAQNRKYYYAKHFIKGDHFSTVIFEREAAADLKADSGNPPRVIIAFDNLTGVHYGGGLEFGPDGFFYIGMGDTGPQGDPHGHAQDTQSLLGKMLRVDVDHVAEGQAYAIPPDNPFVNRADFRPEIWALGFRVPWRFSFDPLNGDLWVGDVGQDRYEEVDLVRRGENYGWNVYEGFEPFSNQYRKEGVVYIPPVFAYGRRFGVSVTGGWVYRGNPKSSFYGVYICGDYQSRRIWGLTQELRKLTKVREIGIAPQRFAAFGRDDQGELYVVGYEGTIYKIDLRDAVFE